MNAFAAVRSEGGLLPSDLLDRVASRSADLPGLTPEAYHLGAGERLNESIARSWNRLLGVWTSYRHALESLPETDLGTTLTRERWLLPLLQELGYGRIPTAGRLEIEGKPYPISHMWERVPVHLLSSRVELDRRTPGVAGAATASPHGMVQEFLNRSEPHLWAVLSNGSTLRLLRDNVSLTRQAYVEFDLKAIFEGELYPDFALMWLVAHQSRFEGTDPEACILEKWCQEARHSGVRALETLRRGVESAIESLGEGFLQHPSNRELRSALRTGSVTPVQFYRVLLRSVYRLIFLFVAEDRDVLLLPEEDAGPGARERYDRYYSTRRLRRMAERRRGTRHSDLWAGLSVVSRALGSDEGLPALALPPLGGFLWTDPAGEEWSIENRYLLEAIRHLATVQEDGALRPVDYRNLGPEELGSVYESLLELVPEVEEGASRFTLVGTAGSDRKSTGSYYTPESLIQALLDSALEPVIQRALRARDPEAALLGLRVIDPAVGSGHFLIAAAHRIAARLAAVREGDGEPSPRETRRALRDVIGSCLFGVDLNPMAAELCKVSLWLEALEPGRPLSFLDHHVQVGNSLLGATPALIDGGIPDEAFQPIEGDERAVVTALRRENREARAGQTSLIAQFAAESRAEYASVADGVRRLEEGEDRTLAAVREKEHAFRRLREGEAWTHARLVADAWCASFMWPKREGAPEPLTHATLLELQRNPGGVSAEVRAQIRKLAEQYRFFHFHLAFPQVFRAPGPDEEPGPSGWVGGFDAVLGNPPWEHTELKEKEWFASRAPSVAGATGAKRKRLIAALEEEDPALFEAYGAAKREADGMSHFARNSGRYPLCGRGRINLYAIFAELSRTLQAETGRVGFIVPSGIATDDTTKFFFQDLVDTGTLASLYDFENRKGLFEEVHRSYKFCLLTLRGRGEAREGAPAEFAFFMLDVADLQDPERRFELTADDIALLNPNTRTCPIFRTRRDAEITKKIYRRVPVLVREGDPEGNPWGVSFSQGLFNMTSASDLFRTREELEAEGWILKGNVFAKEGRRYVPLYEAKMIHHFDYQWATYEGGSFRDVTEAEKADPDFHVMPRYWVPEAEVEARLGDRWGESWLLGFRDICRNTDERTVIASVFPRVGVGNNLPILLSERGGDSIALAAILSSLPLDFVARFKVGGTHLNFFIAEQLPVIAPDCLALAPDWTQGETIGSWLWGRLGALIGLSADGRRGGLSPADREPGSGERATMRAEIDAAFFLLYGLDRAEVDYILDTFPIVRRKDEAEFGEYRTKRLILEKYDEFAGV